MLNPGLFYWRKTSLDCSGFCSKISKTSEMFRGNASIKSFFPNSHPIFSRKNQKIQQTIYIIQLKIQPVAHPNYRSRHLEGIFVLTQQQEIFEVTRKKFRGRISSSIMYPCTCLQITPVLKTQRLGIQQYYQTGKHLKKALVVPQKSLKRFLS